MLTDRHEGTTFNRVGAVDGRFVFRRVYATSFQAGASQTDAGTGPDFGRLWDASIDRNGRNYGFRNSLKGLSSDFRSRMGFINRKEKKRNFRRMFIKAVNWNEFEKPFSIGLRASHFAQ